MKKLIVLAVMVCTLIFSVPFNANAEFGLGYEGVIAGNFLQGISARGWVENLGYEINLFQSTIDVDAEDLGFDDSVDILIYGGKILFAAVVNQNSKFYLGLDAGMGSVELGDEEFDVMSFGPLFGAEYRFQEMPELGFNWEVGYKFTNLEYDDEDVELGINGISISIGVHYYF